MSDIFDEASAREAKDRELAIERHRKNRHGLLPVGACHYCDSPLQSGVLFCDAGCRDDWEAEQQARIRSGR